MMYPQISIETNASNKWIIHAASYSSYTASKSFVCVQYSAWFSQINEIHPTFTRTNYNMSIKHINYNTFMEKKKWEFIDICKTYLFLGVTLKQVKASS